MISIILPVADNQFFLKKTLESLDNQSFKDFEVIIILNGNYELNVNLNLFKFNYRFFRLSEKGVSKARNYGINFAKFDKICFLDSDDVWHPNKLEIQYMEFIKKKCDLSYCRYKILGSSVERNIKKISSAKFLAINNPICTSSVMINKSLFKVRNFIDSRMRSDFDFWLYLRKNNFKLCLTPSSEPLVYYRKHKFNLTFNKYIASFYHFKILNLHFSFVLSCYLELKYLIFNLIPNTISKKFVNIIKP